MTLDVTFKAELAGAWSPVRDIDPERYLAHHLAIPHLSCCDLQAGFFVVHRGRAWNGELTVDEYDNAESWIDGLEAILLRGARETQVWAWEESNCTWAVRGDTIRIQDRSHHRAARCKPIRVSLVDFASGVIRAAREWDQFTVDLRRAAQDLPLGSVAEENLDTLWENVHVEGLSDRLDALEAAVGRLG